MICRRCLDSDKGYTVHCGRCGCCAIRQPLPLPNPWVILAAVISVGCWWAGYKWLWPYIR